MSDLITWCRLFRVGPVCPKPCDDCRHTSRTNALIAQAGGPAVTLAAAYEEHEMREPESVSDAEADACVARLAAAARRLRHPDAKQQVNGAAEVDQSGLGDREVVHHHPEEA